MVRFEVCASNLLIIIVTLQLSKCYVSFISIFVIFMLSLFDNMSIYSFISDTTCSCCIEGYKCRFSCHLTTLVHQMEIVLFTEGNFKLMLDKEVQILECYIQKSDLFQC